MTVDKLQLPLEKLSLWHKKNAEHFLLPSESVFFLVNSLDKKNSLNQFRGRYQTRRENTYFFKNLKTLTDFLPVLPPYIRLLVQLLTPGRVLFKFKKDYETFFASIPANLETQQLLKNYDQPLVGFLPLNYLNLPFFSKEIILEDNLYQQFYFLKTEHKLAGFLPTVLDCTEKNVIKMINPGLIHPSEIRSVLPKFVNFKINFEDEPFGIRKNIQISWKFINNLNTQEDQSMKVVLGTTESLQREFGLEAAGYFNFKMLGNNLLFNIGSQAHLKTLATNLFENLNASQKLGVKQVYFLNPHLKNRNWGGVINQTLKNLGMPLDVPNDLVYDSLPQNLTEDNLQSTPNFPKKVTGIGLSGGFLPNSFQV